jgi:cell wall-associated NlpC family hydrolase
VTYTDTKGVVIRPSLLLLVVAALVVSGCAARGGTPRPFPVAKKTPDAAAPSEPAAAVPAGTTATVPRPVDAIEMTESSQPQPRMPEEAAGSGVSLPDAVVQTALAYLGTPYRSGGSDPGGFDCSGLVQYVFARHGESLPREVRDQFQRGRTVELDEIAAGDLVFFETVTRGASHVGIAIGNDRFVHAPSSRGVVRVEPYTATYWARRFVGARRLAAAPLASVALPGAVGVAR